MKFLISLTVILMTSVFAFANLKINTSASVLKWKGTKLFKVDSHEGVVSLKSGQVKLDKKGMVQSGVVVIDMNSIKNTDLPTKKKKGQLEGHLKNDDFFAVSKFPTATIKILGSTGNPKKQILNAELTIRGKTNKIKIPTTVDVTKAGFKATGKLKFDRSKYDVKYNSKSMFPDLEKTAKDKVIDDMVAIEFSLLTESQLKAN